MSRSKLKVIGKRSGSHVLFRYGCTLQGDVAYIHSEWLEASIKGEHNTRILTSCLSSSLC